MFIAEGGDTRPQDHGTTNKGPGEKDRRVPVKRIRYPRRDEDHGRVCEEKRALQTWEGERLAEEEARSNQVEELQTVRLKWMALWGGLELEG